MPLMQKAVKLATDRMPKIISPGVHAIIDYATAAAFLAMAAKNYRRNKKAALSCAICGTGELLTAMFTDYPGGLTKAISFRTHGVIDVGVATMVASMPNILKFEDDDESRFFTMQSVAMSAVAGLTDFTGTGETKQLDKIQQAAA